MSELQEVNSIFYSVVETGSQERYFKKINELIKLN